MAVWNYIRYNRVKVVLFGKSFIFFPLGWNIGILGTFEREKKLKSVVIVNQPPILMERFHPLSSYHLVHVFKLCFLFLWSSDIINLIQLYLWVRHLHACRVEYLSFKKKFRGYSQKKKKLVVVCGPLHTTLIPSCIKISDIMTWPLNQNPVSNLSYN